MAWAIPQITIPIMIQRMIFSAPGGEVGGMPERIGMPAAFTQGYAGAGLVARLGVARILSPDVRVGPPDRRSLPCPLRFAIHGFACSHSPLEDTGNPSLDR